MRQSPLLICSECGLVETELLECPNCRSRRLKRQASPRPKFQTASRLRFDIEQTDSLAIDIGERVCLVGNCSTLADRPVVVDGKCKKTITVRTLISRLEKKEKVD